MKPVGGLAYAIIVLLWLFVVVVFFRTVLPRWLGTRIKVFCPACEGFIPTNEEWICGHCDHRNAPLRLHFSVSLPYFYYASFLDKCANCQAPPSSYQCFHCGALVSLDDTDKRSHPARHPTKRPPAPPAPPAAETVDQNAARVARERKDAIEEREHLIARTRLDRELAEERLRLQSLERRNEPAKPLRQRYEDDLAEKKAQEFAVEEIVSREKKAAAVLYKDDPERHKDYLHFLENWREKQLMRD